MLLLDHDATLGDSRWRSVMTLERRFGSHVFQRDALLSDTRYLAPTKKAFGVANVFVIVSGEVAVDGVPVGAGPLAFVLAEAELERRVVGARTLRIWGRPARGVLLRFKTQDLSCPIGLEHGPLRLRKSTLEQFETATLRLDDRVAVAHAVMHGIEGLTAEGVIAPAVRASLVIDEPEHLTRLWGPLSAMYARASGKPTLRQLAQATGLSLPQLGRDLLRLATTFGMFSSRYQETQRVLRLRAAVLWLSAPGVTASDVALHVGYSGLDAMGRAFRDAGLDAPSVVQAAVRFPR